MKNIFELIHQLQKEGQRITKIRKILLEILLEQEKPFSIPELLTVFKKKNISVNKTTLYREVDFFKKKGFLHEIRFNDRMARYESTFSKHHHHFICIKCENIEDVELQQDLEKEEKLLEKKRRLKILRHSLEFFGLCKRCQVS